MVFSVERFVFGKNEKEWNEFVGLARNTTFLFNRNFMDYHKERFKDHSVLVRNQGGKVVAGFPAHESGSEIFSHKGLTYGGLMLEREQKLTVTLAIYNAILDYYAGLGIKRITYKAFPRFYNDLQTDEIEYCLFRSNAKLIRRDTSLAIDRTCRIMYAGNIRREARKAANDGVTIQEEETVNEFWTNILVPNLSERFSVKPAHTAEEMSLLKGRFPEQIRFFSARSHAREMLAGTVLFITNNTVHCQYISGSARGRDSGALNLLFTTLLDEYFLNHRFFDFGTANENDGMKLNEGLLAWKERMGGRAYAHDFYIIETSNLLPSISD